MTARVQFSLIEFDSVSGSIDWWLKLELSQHERIWSVATVENRLLQEYPKLAGLRARSQFRLVKKIVNYISKIESRRENVRATR